MGDKRTEGTTGIHRTVRWAEHERNTHFAASQLAVAIERIQGVVVLICSKSHFPQRNLCFNRKRRIHLCLTEDRFLERKHGPFALDRNTDDRIDLGEGAWILEGKGVAVSLPVRTSVIEGCAGSVEALVCPRKE